MKKLDRQHISSIQRWKENSKPIIQETLNGEFIKEWSSTKDAIKEFGSHVSSVLNGKRKHTKGCFWRYK